MSPKKTLQLAFGLLIIFNFVSCRSHKKQGKQDFHLGDVIEVEFGEAKTIGEKIAKESLTWLGTPYGYGCCAKGEATDCSGMVLTVYEMVAEIKLPRNSAQQAEICHDLKEKDIEPGDLVFFATGKNRKHVSHVGVMIDKCRFVHASSSKGVILSEMTTPYYQKTFIKYGRVPH